MQIGTTQVSRDATPCICVSLKISGARYASSESSAKFAMRFWERSSTSAGFVVDQLAG